MHTTYMHHRHMDDGMLETSSAYNIALLTIYPTRPRTMGSEVPFYFLASLGRGGGGGGGEE